MPGLSPEHAIQQALSALPPALLRPPVGLAVSGGSDSLALLVLAAGWAARQKAGLIAFTVDHGLRPEAAAEAASVATVAARFGIPHRTIPLTGLAPRQASLRRARHAVLAAALKEAGGQLMLTGHTADDQAETFLLRARQGSGWYGLAGMRRLSLSPVWPEGAGVWLARPLLSLRRQALRGELAGQGLGWADDPSNADTAYERVRMRARLAASPGLFGQIMACQSRLSLLQQLEDRALARWLTSQVRSESPGITAGGFEALPPARAARGLGLLLQIAAGRETPQRGDALARLAARLAQPEAFRGATLGGARLSPQGRQVSITPETGQEGAGAASLRAWRLAATAAILGGTVPEIDASAGKESFLATSVPIF